MPLINQQGKKDNSPAQSYIFWSSRLIMSSLCLKCLQSWIQHLQYPSTSSWHSLDVLVTRREGHPGRATWPAHSLPTLGRPIVELWEDLQGFCCLGLENDHRHPCSTLDVLPTTRKSFVLSPTKLTDERGLCLSSGEVTFLRIPSSTCFSLSSFSAAYTRAASPPTNIHGVLGTLSPPSSHCKEAISYLASIHSPSHAFQRVCLSPVKVFVPTVPGVPTPPCVMMDWPTALPEWSERVTSIPFFTALFVSVDRELPSPIFKSPLVNKSKIFNRMACWIQERNRASGLPDSVSSSIVRPLLNTLPQM